MKLTLKQLLVSHTSTQNDVISVKQEEMFHGRKFDQPDKKNKYRWSSLNKLNPVNKNNLTSWCIACNSTVYWASNCPHNPQSANILEDKPDSCEEVNIVLITEDLEKNKVFVVGKSKIEAINTICTKTVPVEKWYNNFRNNLPNDFKAKIENLPNENFEVKENLPIWQELFFQ